MFSLDFDEETIDFLSKLPKDLRKRIFNKLSSTKKDPFHYFEKLTGVKSFKLRVGDYRIIADINKNSKKIQVIFIGHRKNVYEKL